MTAEPYAAAGSGGHGGVASPPEGQHRRRGRPGRAVRRRLRGRGAGPARGRRVLRAGQRDLAAGRRPVRPGRGAALGADPGAAPAGHGRRRPAQRLAARPGRQAGRYLLLPRGRHLRRPGQREPGRRAGAGGPRARPGHGYRDRPSLRRRGSRAAAVGARGPGGFGARRRPAVRHAARGGGRGRLPRRDGRLGRTARCPARDHPGQRDAPWRSTSPASGPSCGALRRPRSPWASCSTRPAWARRSRSCGRTCGTRRSPRCPAGHATCTATRPRRR